LPVATESNFLQIRKWDSCFSDADRYKELSRKEKARREKDPTYLVDL